MNLFETKKCKCIPKGGIIMWSGCKIPHGYKLCNGNNNTPNLSDRFILGCGTNKINSTGGSNYIALNENNLPPHNHTYQTVTAEDVTYKIASPFESSITLTTIVPTVTVTGDGNGESVPICTTPTFYTLAFIMKK